MVGTDESHAVTRVNPRLRLAGELGGGTGRVTLAGKRPPRLSPDPVVLVASSNLHCSVSLSFLSPVSVSFRLAARLADSDSKSATIALAKGQRREPNLQTINADPRYEVDARREIRIGTNIPQSYHISVVMQSANQTCNVVC